MKTLKKIRDMITNGWRSPFRPALAGLLFLGLMLAPLTPAKAQSFVSPNFINGFNLQVLTLTTNTYSGTNTYAVAYTQTNSTIYPYVSGRSPVTKTNTQAFSDVTLWANRDGTPPIANISVDVQGINANFTNLVTFNFAAIPNGSEDGFVPLNPCTDASNLFSFSVTGNGTNDVVVKTNLPTALLQGARALRCLSVTDTCPGGTGGTNGTVLHIKLNGYKPVIQ